jgi:peptidoglycan hydrolase-like protein with peptidoglycan-binding domain
VLLRPIETRRTPGPTLRRRWVVGAGAAALLLPTSMASADPKPGSTGKPATTRPATKQASPAKRSTSRPATGKTSSGKVSGFGSGAKGEAVSEIQSLLQAANYDIRDVNGTFGDQTFHAVMAFQKANGLARTGRVGEQTLAAIRSGLQPEPIVPDGGPDRIEVSIPKQYLALYRGGKVVRILSISTGSGKPFCTLDPETNETACDEAITPPGSFRVARRVIGWRESKLGLMYNPLYFNGGIAVHGAPSVPGNPASHGCVRIPMVSADFMPTVIPDGIPVYVSDGKTPLRIISSKISAADAWPGTTPAPTTAAPGPSTTGLIATLPPTTLPGATTVPGSPTTVAPTSIAPTTAPATIAPTTTLAPTTTNAPTLVRPLPTTTVAAPPIPPAT